MNRTLHAAGNRGHLSGLVVEQIDRVAGVMPQQVVGPATRLTQRVHVAATEEVGLHIELLQLQLTGDDLVMDPLVAGVEATRVAGHGNQAGFACHLDDLDRIGQAIGHRDLNHHVLAGTQGLDSLRGMHLRRRGQQHGLKARLLEAFADITRVVRDVELTRHLGRGLLVTTGQGDDLDAGDIGHSLQMLDAEGALSCQTDLHGVEPQTFSRMM